MSRPAITIAHLGLPAALLGWTIGGCAPATKPAASPEPGAAAHEKDHDHGDHDHGHDHGDHAHPETLAEGIAELEKAAADVAAKLAEGAEEAADDAIHLAGHVVEDVKALLAKQEGLADEAKQAGEKALAELFEAFDKVDQAMHSGAEDVKAKAVEAHESVKESIQAAVMALKETFTKEEK
jgi:flagellar biosynthesis/type III secretory pathway protein FliH